MEYSSSDDAREVGKKLKDVPLNIGNEKVNVNMAIIKINGTRNWSLRVAEIMIKESPKSNKEK